MTRETENGTPSPMVMRNGAPAPDASDARVLLFGAFANGNIGDQFQANSVAHHLARLAPAIEVHATANSKAARSYEFAENDRRDAKTIMDADVVNGYSALVIGGGGLLASIHGPLNDSAWLDGIRIPIVLLAVGASEEVAEACRALVERATVVTARDEFSLGVLSRMRADTGMLNDPILSDRRLDRETSRERRDAHRLCVIPRKQTSKNEPVYRALAPELTRVDAVLSMFPATDTASGALSHFAGSMTIEAWKMAELVDALDNATEAVSERYHGCILAMKRATPCLGLINADDLARSKIAELYRQLGHTHLLTNLRRTPLGRQQIIDKLAAEFDATVVASALARIEDEFDRGFTDILCRIGLA